MILIAAVDKNWGIGCDGELLLQSKRDREFFRNITINHTVIMGRKTLESLPGGKPLKNRRNIVISRQPGYSPEGVIVISSVDECIKKYTFEENCFIIGGESIYRAFLHESEEALLTKADCEVKADVFFPNLDKSDYWKQTEVISKWKENGITYEICRYINLKKI